MKKEMFCVFIQITSNQNRSLTVPQLVLRLAHLSFSTSYAKFTLKRPAANPDLNSFNLYQSRLNVIQNMNTDLNNFKKLLYINYIQGFDCSEKRIFLNIYKDI